MANIVAGFASSHTPLMSLPGQDWAKRAEDDKRNRELIRPADGAHVSYDELLKIFWENHDPTQLNRQGPDSGTQYRSAIFFHSPEQEAAAKASKEALARSGRFAKPVVTQIVPATTFYEAEDYHQQYLEKRGLASCHIKR